MAFRAHVLRPDDLPIVDRGGGVRTVPLVTARVGAQAFLDGITEFDPGASLPMHSHNCEEPVMVLEGQAAFEGEEGTVDMGPLDTTWVPPGAVHRFFNRGPGRMRILWTYGSVSATRTVAETGETFAVGSALEHAEAGR
jgi:quercetin dioxygenase-like cupin family protein